MEKQTKTSRGYIYFLASILSSSAGDQSLSCSAVTSDTVSMSIWLQTESENRESARTVVTTARGP